MSLGFRAEHPVSSSGVDLQTPQTGSRIRSVLLTAAIAVGFYALPLEALAQGQRIAVVRSPENVRQWPGITQRLQQVGVDYCILDLSEVQAGPTLQQVGVLVLPNLETLTGSQVTTLDSWVRNGGKVIVTGPTGSLSQPEVRSQLRTLLGAYWGFPLTSPSTLQLNPIAQTAWRSSDPLSSTLRGGVIIPASRESQTVAVWQADGTPPAVVTTREITFFGWRWGSDEVATVDLDSAWLQAALQRYGTTPAPSSFTAQSCTGGRGAAQLPPSPTQTTPTAGRPTTERPTIAQTSTSARPPATTAAPPPVPLAPPVQTAQNLPEDDDAPFTPPPRRFDPNRPGTLAPAEIRAMQADLERLVGRYESAQLSAQATQGDLSGTLSQAIEQSLNGRANTQFASTQLAAAPMTNARQGLTNFQNYVAQGDYNQAREQWRLTQGYIWDNYPISGVIQTPETRAMWLDRGSIVRAGSEAGLARIFDRLANAGINTVFFETLNASYPIYPSSVAPEQNPLTQGWDPLASAVKLAHERGMELHAWVWIFAAANQRHNILLRQPPEYLGPVLTRNPQWASLDRQGNVFKPNTRKAFFDPANPEVRAYLLSIVDEIATKYDVDGIHLDYIRYPFQDPRVNQTHGYGIAGRTRFRQLTGVDPATLTPSHPLWNQWTQFRIQQVDQFVAETSELLKRKHPDLILSGAVFPLPTQERLSRLQQNWEGWIQQGQIDLLVPMTYARDTDSFEQLTEPLFNRGMTGATLVLPGIRLLGLPTMVTVDQMQHTRNSPTGGYALFAAQNLSLNLQQVLRQSQGQLGRGRPPALIPHRSPFKAAQGRYDALQREWQFLVSQNRLPMEERQMREWGRQSAAVAIALEELAARPSAPNLNRARSELTTFQRQFGSWMQQYGQQSPYQVQAWQNRLVSIDVLLRYGEQVELRRGR
ncbi:family 10 glycosylhydrolase [Spirulina subsalsa]|uniref:family 10 glycosylhydrolase n=1 Tax=Spirulina subsalsa TaxID=54311 RepID=UPI002238AAA2|nr:family 10 glycosylhydrolase [Spirulina subsalsa]